MNGTERQRKYKDNMAQAGFIRLNAYVHQTNKERVIKFIARIEKQRKRQENKILSGNP